MSLCDFFILGVERCSLFCFLFVSLLIAFQLQCLFKLTGNTSTTNSGIATREWQHKNAPYAFWQGRNKRNKSWNTGVYNKKLEVLAYGSSLKYGIEVRTRAKCVLGHRKNNKPAGLTGSTNIYSAAENLPHLVRAMQLIVSTGAVNSFFDNPFVKDFCRHLNDRHPWTRLFWLRQQSERQLDGRLEKIANMFPGKL